MHGTTVTLTVVIAALAAGCGTTRAAPALLDPPATTNPSQPTIPTTTTTSAVPTGVGRADDGAERRKAIEAETKRLWFGWYAAVAAGDSAALGETVALNRIHADGVRAIENGTLRFTTRPVLDRYRFDVLDVLRDDEDCLVVEVREDPGAFLADAVVAERIAVFWNRDDRWYLATSWGIHTPEFAWSDDCTLMVREFA